MDKPVDSGQCVYGEKSLAAQLIASGASPDAVEPETGNTLLHLTAQHVYQDAGIFLAHHGATAGLANLKVRRKMFLILF